MRETIKNLKFVKTCDACPEQYDVYQGDKKVAYIRLRWGTLCVRTYENNEISDTVIYSKDYPNGWKGSFDDNEE